MEFKEDKAIYLQIADYICDNLIEPDIIKGETEIIIGFEDWRFSE